MATYVLLHGAGSDAWYWNRVVPGLEGLGHEVIAPDLPCDDEEAGLGDSVSVVLDAIGDRRGVVLVAQSLAGLTAPVVCARAPVDLLVLVAAMVPLPGETGSAWWANTGHAEALRHAERAAGRDPDAPFDPLAMFFHDVPDDVTRAAFRRGARAQADGIFADPCPLERWPDVETRFLLCRDDRIFPADFLRRVVRERLGLAPDEMDGGHLPALARPHELVERLEAYRRDLEPRR